MRWLRAGARLVLVALLTLLFLIVLLTGLLVMLPLPRARARWRRFIFHSWSKTLLCVLGVTVSAAGRPPAAPFLLVSNRRGYLDILVIGSQVGAIFVAKSEIANWPVIGFLCHSVNTIFVDRTLRRDLPRVMKEIDHELGLGMGVVLFAEGTSSRGATVLPFRPSLLEPAIRSELPVSYAALSYHTPEDAPPAHLAVCWWGGMTFHRHALKLATLRCISAKVSFGDEPLHDADRKRLAERLRQAVLNRFDPVVEEMD